MWPLVEVHTTAAAWGYFLIGWAALIIGPMLIGGIINAVWWKSHFQKKIAEIEQELGNKKERTPNIHVPTNHGPGTGIEQ